MNYTDILPLRKAAIRDLTPLRSPHHMNTIPIPAVTNVAKAATIVDTEICAVNAEITLDQSEAVTVVPVSSAKAGKAIHAETPKVAAGSRYFINMFLNFNSFTPFHGLNYSLNYSFANSLKYMYLSCNWAIESPFFHSPVTYIA